MSWPGVGYIPRWFTCPQTATHPSSNHLMATQPGVELTTFWSLSPASWPLRHQATGASYGLMTRKRKDVDKSPAVARVRRPYSWCTLATCVHNCPSMMFRTCCCLRPKCKRSYLLIYITSGSYVNKLCKQVKRPIPPRNTCIANCRQTAAVSDMVTIDSL